MTKHNPHINNQPLYKEGGQVQGYLTEMDGEPVYCIRNYDRMPPFLMSIVSSSDLWMYLSSSGGLTAGRQNFNNTLFPYETDDKLHETAHNTGPKTIFSLKEKGKTHLWEPFSDRYEGLYQIQRNLYKNTPGNKVVFEEINETLELVFRYSWTSSDELGWIRKAALENRAGKERKIVVCDGLLNLLPWGIKRESQSMMSTLMDAYKVSEFRQGKNMALYYLSSIPVDRAEPAEALRTNIAWSFGLKPDSVLLSPAQLGEIRKGGSATHEDTVFGQKLAYLLYANIRLASHEESTWFIMTDVALDSSDVSALQRRIATETNSIRFIENSIAESTKRLEHLVAKADGIQQTGDPFSDRRHFSNVLFNIMRGGIFEQGDTVEVDDFMEHLYESNRAVYERHKGLFEQQQRPLRWQDLLQLAGSVNDADLLRISLEYLPLSFGRRHGDPSRPWNYFDIRVKKSDGSPARNYQGNWRDIFQNWEALSFSFPSFLPGMIARFLNATTADGYNPYRITRQGFDWEVPEPDNPWAHIGYWGDHQIVYLLRLMEMQERFHPGSLLQNADRAVYAYARVPFRIKSYQEILEDPRDTILFEEELHDHLMNRSREEGHDAKLMIRNDGGIQKATFIEKIMVSLLTKLGNFVPEAGIWLNTQRPEWNDANNALTGYGASMVTLCHIRSCVTFLIKIITEKQEAHFRVAREVATFYEAVAHVFTKNKTLLKKGFSAADRKNMTDMLGLAGEKYRSTVYKGFSGETSDLSTDEILVFYRLVLSFCDQTIDKNRRSDGLYHAYNLMDFGHDSIDIHRLTLMLEGQAAVLSSGYLDPQRTLELMKALFDSDLWRADQQSFMLYPFRHLPGFMEKNSIPKNQITRSGLLQDLIDSGNEDIIKRDEAGHYHFNAGLQNARMLKETLARLDGSFDSAYIASETPVVLDIYEKVFNHRFFTGRSGSFYKYEGLGSIYWHMVSKLLLVLGERIQGIAVNKSDSGVLPLLRDYYYRIKNGIGMHKQPGEYGAFPTDPYSHTPSMMGAQQPGMTGQVKEDILSRFKELGVYVAGGKIHFLPVLLRMHDFDQEGSFCFSYCGTDIWIKKAASPGLEIHYRDGSPAGRFDHGHLDEDTSNKIFSRHHNIDSLVFYHAD